MTTGVNTAAVLTQAKNVLQQTSSSLKKETKLEKQDMTKYQSIFTKADNLAQNSGKKSENIQTNALNKLKDKNKIAEAQSQMYKELQAEVKKLNEQRLNEVKKQEDAKKEMDQDQQNALQATDTAALLKSNFKTKKQTKEVKVKVPTNGNDGKSETSGSSEKVVTKTINYETYEASSTSGSQSSGQSDAMQRYLEATRNIANIDAQIKPIEAKMAPIQERLASIGEAMTSINKEAATEMESLKNETKSSLEQSVKDLRVIETSQSKSKGINTENSKGASSMSKMASNAATESDDETESSDLKKASKDLNDVSTKTDTLAKANDTNIQKIGTEGYNGLETKNSDFISKSDGYLTTLNNEYTSYMNSNVKPYLNESQAKNIDNAMASVPGTKGGGDLAKSAASKAGSMAQGALNGADMGDMLKDMAISTGMDLAKGVLDKIMPGLGAGLDMLGSIFGGFF